MQKDSKLGNINILNYILFSKKTKNRKSIKTGHEGSPSGVKFMLSLYINADYAEHS